MKKTNYKGRCEKRKVSKCEGICRTYNKIQSAFVDELENDDNILSFECNVLLKGVANDLYSSDFVAKRVDTVMSQSSKSITNCSMKPWNGTTKIRHALTDGSKITMRRSVPANRKSPSMN